MSKVTNDTLKERKFKEDDLLYLGGDYNRYMKYKSSREYYNKAIKLYNELKEDYNLITDPNKEKLVKYIHFSLFYNKNLIDARMLLFKSITEFHIEPSDCDDWRAEARNSFCKSKCA